MKMSCVWGDGWRGIVAAVLGAWLAVAGGPSIYAQSGAADEAASPVWAYLGVERELEYVEAQNGLLARELVRQAVLLAVRDELGGLTRDMVLDEPWPGDATPGLAVQARMQVDPTAVTLTLHALDEDGTVGEAWQTLEATLDATRLETLSYRSLATTMEQWSRGPLAEAMAGRGMAGQAHAWHEQGEVSPEVGRLLGEFDVYALFEAIRLTHRSIREQGESPERLGALVRGYALLGQLTHHHWNASEQVFYARAMLYAERLVHKTDGSAWAHWHRAYAMVMAGLEGWAVVDLAAAREAEADAPDAPEWVDLVGDFAYGHTASLERAGEANHAQTGLARYLRFMLAERRYDLDTTTAYGEWALEQVPGAVRIVDAMASLYGVSNLHRQTQQGPLRLHRMTVAALGALQDLPAPVRALRPRLAAAAWPSPVMAELVAELVAASDPADCRDEMSWAVFGRLMQEAHFIQVYRRVIFQKFVWSVGVEDLIEPAAASLGDHRYRTLVEALALDKNKHAREIDRLMLAVDFGDMNLTTMYTLYHHSWWGNAEAAERRETLWQRTRTGTDNTAPALSRWLTGWTKSGRDVRLRRAELLAMITPVSPLATAVRLTLDWEAVQDELPAIELRFANDPTVQKALAERYLRHEMTDRAEQTLKQYIDLTRSQWGYVELAQLYLAAGDEARWLATLEQYLEAGQDRGLRQARVRQRIAEHFMADHRYAEAQPYAEAAAQTWAGWAMSTASLCYEGLQDWPRAELWAQRTSERYSHLGASAFNWYWWCQRTGRGHRQAAAAVAQQYVDSLDFDGEVSQADRSKIGLFYITMGDHQQALRWLESYIERQPVETPWAAMYVMMIAERTGDTALLGETADRLAAMRDQKYGTIWWDVVAELVHAFRPSLSPGEGALPDLAEVDALIERISPEPKIEAMLCYFVAEMLVIAGHADKAQPYYARCVSPTYLDRLDHTMAYWSMRQHGLDPYDLLAEQEAD